MVEALGWAATAVFVGSYFCTHARALIRVQMVGALMWTAYGVLVGAPPVVAANLLVLAAAAWKSRRPPAAVAPADGAARAAGPPECAATPAQPPRAWRTRGS
jgi:hypothetical protein